MNNWAQIDISFISSQHVFITKIYLYNFDPLKPHFYIVKLGFTGVYIAKRDSGGIIIYVKSELYNRNMLVKTDSDDIIWLKFAPGVISDKPLYLCLCYVLPSGTSRQPVVKTSVFD